MKIARSVGFMLILLVTVIGSGEGQAKKQTAPVFPLWKFDKMRVEGSCGAKGRLQDRGYCSSKLVDEIVAQGKSAIPILISQMLDPRETERPIYDYWSYTTAGDIAYFMLNDLFTDADWKTFTLPELDVPKEPCDEASETCWRRFVEKYGRRFIQERWEFAWNSSKDRIYWDVKARCFRVKQQNKDAPAGRRQHLSRPS